LHLLFEDEIPSEVFSICAKYLRKHLKKRKFVIWLIVSDVSDSGWFSLVLWSCGETEHHSSRSIWQSKVAHLMETKETERERQEGLGEDRLSVTFFLQLGPTF
jgi:hypothetical protein